MANTKRDTPVEVGTKRKPAAKKTEPIFEGHLDISNAAGSDTKAPRKMTRQTAKKKSTALSRSLSKKASEGDVKSARRLLSIAEAKAEKLIASDTKRGPSEAMELSAEPEWQEPVIESFSETMDGRLRRKADGEP